MERGAYCERCVAQLLKDNGYDVERSHDHECWDLRTARLRAEYSTRDGFYLEIKCWQERTLLPESRERLLKQSAKWPNGQFKGWPIFLVLVETSWKTERRPQRWPTLTAVKPEDIWRFVADEKSGLSYFRKAFADYDISFTDETLQACRRKINLRILTDSVEHSIAQYPRWPDAEFLAYVQERFSRITSLSGY